MACSHARAPARMAEPRDRFTRSVWNDGMNRQRHVWGQEGCMVATTVRADAEVDTLVDAAKRLRIEFAATAAEVDARGEMPLANLQRIHELGFNRFLVPREFGGIVERPS